MEVPYSYDEDELMTKLDVMRLGVPQDPSEIDWNADPVRIVLPNYSPVMEFNIPRADLQEIQTYIRMVRRRLINATSTPQWVHNIMTTENEFSLVDIAEYYLDSRNLNRSENEVRLVWALFVAVDHVENIQRPRIYNQIMREHALATGLPPRRANLIFDWKFYTISMHQFMLQPGGQPGQPGPEEQQNTRAPPGASGAIGPGNQNSTQVFEMEHSPSTSTALPPCRLFRSAAPSLILDTRWEFITYRMKTSS